MLLRALIVSLGYLCCYILVLKPFLTFFPHTNPYGHMLLLNVFATLRDYITKVNRLIELGLPVVALNEETTVLQVVVSEKIVKEVLRERGFLISLPFEKVTEFVGSAFFLV